MDEWENCAKNTQAYGSHFGGTDEWDTPVKNTLLTRTDPFPIPVCMRRGAVSPRGLGLSISFRALAVP